MGAFQSSFNDSLDKAIVYFKNWNAVETEKALQILDNLRDFLGDLSKEFQQDTKDFINNVAKLIPELINVETSLAQTIFKEIGEVVKDSANIINAESTGFAIISSKLTLNVQLAIANSLRFTVSKALNKDLVAQNILIDSLNKIAGKINVQSLIGSLQKINPDLKVALTDGITITLSGALKFNQIVIPTFQSVFTGVISVVGTYSGVQSFAASLSGVHLYFTFKGITIFPGPDDDIIAVTVESKYKVKENLVPFQRFVNSVANKNRGFQILNVAVENESPEIDAYLHHQSIFNESL